MVGSIVVALAAAFYASLLPELPVPSQVAKAATALSNLSSRIKSSTTNVTMAPRPPVYFFSHGGVRRETLYLSSVLKPTLKSARCHVQH